MSVLVIGGDKINPIEAVLKDFGFEEVLHWSGRKESVNHKSIPQRVECVVMLTSYLKHNMMKRFRGEAKKKEIPVVCAKHSVSSVYQECTKIFGEKGVCNHQCDDCQNR